MRPSKAYVSVPAYGGSLPKDRRERFVLAEFCRHMRARFNASYKAVSIGRALREHWVREVDGATVDGVIRTANGLIAVELLGYSPLDDRGDVSSRDLAFRKTLKRVLGRILSEKGTSISISYKEQPRPNAMLGVVLAVPPTRQFGMIARELSQVAKLVPSLGFCELHEVEFCPRNLMDCHASLQDVQLLDPTEFPLCASHFSRVRFQGVGEVPIQIGSNLSTGWVGLDEEWTAKKVGKKADKSLVKSADRANGLPLWLLVHSDGHATNEVIHETGRQDAVELTRTVLHSMEHRFERVYWVDNTGFRNAAWVGRVI